MIIICINLTCMGTILFTGQLATIQRKTMGTMLVGAMISNNVFMFPFVMAGFDKDFASQLVSASILMGLIYVPILMFLLGV